ncbi:hypothetical protein HY489_04260 [Candidatus Woesearchaeota archaeon]|nr:hypothetical protein [Candidatus Woesearchaeota archaeon]
METTNRQGIEVASSHQLVNSQQANSQELIANSQQLTAGQEPSAQPHEDKRVPARRFTTGAISATVWKNSNVNRDGKVFETHTVSLQRRYADRSGQWQSTNSLRVNDLPKAMLVLDEAYKFLVLQSKEEAQ